MTTPELAVEVDGLTKRFGDKLALDGVDLTVREGQIFGFLGPNGAGKSTTLRILLGLAAPTSGTARIFGDDVTRAGNRVRSQIGFLPDVPGYYPWMTAPDFLRFTGQLFGLDAPTIAERSEALLAMAGLSGVDQKVGGFSRGMKQRLGIAQALMNAPRLLLLDEPTSALDPRGRKEVLDMIASLRGRTTVMFSTHLLGDVERVCDEVGILDAGRVVVQAELAELRRRYGGQTRLRLELLGDPDDSRRLVADLEALPWCPQATPDEDGWLVSVTDLDRAAREIPAACAQLGLGIRRLEPVQASLEDVFLSIVDEHKESR